MHHLALAPKSQFKRGATSIYVVIVVMLLLTVITASFIRIIISEANKTTGDSLAQSAYDSALAGVEDAKIAIKKYYDCSSDANRAATEECVPVISAFTTGLGAGDISDPSDPRYGYCDIVGEALERIDPNAAVREVLIKESSDTSRAGSDHIVQAYTCIMVDNTLGDYRSSLSSSSPVRVVPLRTTNPGAITGIRISWYTSEDGDFRALNFGNKDYFHPFGSPLATPPTISARLLQSTDPFTLDQFEANSGDTTNTGTVFLVPTDDSTAATHLSAGVLTYSNDHQSTNPPQKVYCNKNSGNEFACSVSIAIPRPVGGNTRNNETFYLILDLPYEQPKTTFAVQLCKDASGTCEGEGAIADFVDAQVAIDATGRANDMYSRVEARVEFSDIFFPFPRYAIDATGSDDASVNKNFYVTDDCLRWNTDGTIAGPCANSADISDTP